MRHIYVHVPFCRRRCAYCDFSIAVRKQVPADRFVAAIQLEYELRRLSEGWDTEPLETLYLGGGTPSLLPPDHIARLVEFAIEHQPPSPALSRPRPPSPALSRPLETTLEANPDDVDRNTTRAWLSAGVNRVSLGVQSFDQRVLDWMHRTHTAEQSREAVEVLREEGVPSVSLDLIFGLPRELDSNFEADLEQAVRLMPDHLSVYGLTTEPRTPLARWIARGVVSPGPQEMYEREFLRAHEVLTAAGYEHYEVSNYAHPGHASRHNAAYWSGRRYGGLGPAAHRFDGVIRSWNVAPWAEYQQIVGAGGDPTAGSERLSPDQAVLEEVYLSLRTIGGLPADHPMDLNAAVLSSAGAAGWLAADAQGIRCTPRGWLRLDSLVTALTTSASGG